MSPREPFRDELEDAGLDPDDGGFHEDEDAANPHDDVDGRGGPGAFLLSRGDAGEDARPFEDERPSGARLRASARAPQGDLSVRSVGAFLVHSEGFKRWRCLNTLTQIEHVTYGTEEEVNAQLLVQTESWHRRLGPAVKVKGAAWRGKHFSK